MLRQSLDKKVYHLKELNMVNQNFISLKKKTGRFDEVRKNQAEKRFEYWVKEFILQKTKSTKNTEFSYEEHQKNASELKSNPISEAKIFVDGLFS